MTNILEQIIAHKKIEITTLDAPLLRRAAEQSPIPRDFLSAISLDPFALSATQTKRGEVRGMEALRSLLE